MKHHRQTTRQSASPSRGGFAPIELIMLVPLLVLMAALMLCFTHAALFKIRSQSTVHYAATQTEPFRNSSYALNDRVLNPGPQNWPEPGTIGTGGSRDLQDVEYQFWNQVAEIDAKALQGNAGSGGGDTSVLRIPFEVPGDYETWVRVNRPFMLERGMHAGRVTTQQTFPMLQTILSNNGRYSIDHHFEFLEGDWNYGDTGLSSNAPFNGGSVRSELWRANELYDIHPDRLRQLSPLFGILVTNFQNAFQALRALDNRLDPSSPNSLELPNIDDLDALDADLEWTWYRDGWPPNFHVNPRTSDNRCERSLEEYLRSGDHENYLRRVRSVPGRMCRSWQNVYRTELANRNDPNQPDYVPRGLLSDAELEAKLEQLDDWEELLRAGGFW